jgi:hypothetical protein
MPQILKTVDQIAYERGQEILLVTFQSEEQRKEIFPTREHDAAARRLFLAWLKQNPDIEYLEAYPAFGDGWISYPYAGTLAIIASEKDQPEVYKRAVETWEFEDGKPRHPNTRLWIVEPSLFLKRTPMDPDDL